MNTHTNVTLAVITISQTTLQTPASVSSHPHASLSLLLSSLFPPSGKPQTQNSHDDDFDDDDDDDATEKHIHERTEHLIRTFSRPGGVAMCACGCLAQSEN